MPLALRASRVQSKESPASAEDTSISYLYIAKGLEENWKEKPVF